MCPTSISVSLHSAIPEQHNDGLTLKHIIYKQSTCKTDYKVSYQTCQPQCGAMAWFYSRVILAQWQHCMKLVKTGLVIWSSISHWNGQAWCVNRVIRLPQSVWKLEVFETMGAMLVYHSYSESAQRKHEIYHWHGEIYMLWVRWSLAKVWCLPLLQ